MSYACAGMSLRTSVRPHNGAAKTTALAGFQRSNALRPRQTSHKPKPRCYNRVVASADGALNLLGAYETAVSASPTLTKSVTSLVGFAIADVVAQVLSKPKDGRFSLDLARIGRIGLFGLAFYGPASGAWYGYLDSHVMPDNPTSASAVALKTAADQLLWAPILITTLFAWDLCWSEEQSLNQLPQKFRQDLLATLLVNWTFWPAFHLVNFRFVSPTDRVLYVNVVQVFFNVFLCWQAAKQLSEETDEEVASQ
eukprot:CAMPEP_0118923856 /NCGR_PEP_ID=MMETSP1169-20130426/2237_1 /TAXON_ID=36882 /ORGANISM="Pyramimonas obovata, Strain CCMP722" /LENGTH=252 /DNA_ID=CAMNT_0006864911 /DNA_START=46 /DNA_END=804 /DNA_ORIENTATION=+